VCSECWQHLSRQKPAVPPCSLVRVDTGPWPVDARGALPQPTYVEHMLLSCVVASRKMMVLRPTRGPGRGFQKKELTGHVVVLPGTNVEKLHTMLLPRSFEDLPALMTVRAAGGGGGGAVGAAS
jgi:hypothetical protein